MKLKQQLPPEDSRTNSGKPHLAAPLLQLVLAGERVYPLLEPRNCLSLPRLADVAAGVPRGVRSGRYRTHVFVRVQSPPLTKQLPPCSCAGSTTVRSRSTLRAARPDKMEEDSEAIFLLPIASGLSAC